MNLLAPGPEPADRSDLRPLVTFTLVALPVGWVLLSIPLVTGLPLSPFILGTLYLGLLHATFNASSELVAAGSDWVRLGVTLTLGLAALAAYRRLGRIDGRNVGAAAPNDADSGAGMVYR